MIYEWDLEIDAKRGFWICFSSSRNVAWSVFLPIFYKEQENESSESIRLFYEDQHDFFSRQQRLLQSTDEWFLFVSQFIQNDSSGTIC